MLHALEKRQFNMRMNFRAFGRNFHTWSAVTSEFEMSTTARLGHNELEIQIQQNVQEGLCCIVLKDHSRGDGDSTNSYEHATIRSH